MSGCRWEHAGRGQRAGTRWDRLGRGHVWAWGGTGEQREKKKRESEKKTE